MTLNNAWWGYSLTHGWVVLDRDDPRNSSRYKLCFIRCSDWAELTVSRDDWGEPEYTYAPNYFAELPENCRAGYEALLDEIKEKWKEKKVTLALEKVNQANEEAIAARRAFWKSEIQQDIDDENYIRAKERYSRNCADWWAIDFNELLTQIKELNERRLAIVKLDQERIKREEQQREIEAKKTQKMLALAKMKAAANIVERQQFDAYWRLRLAALALSYLTNKPVDTSNDSNNSACWVLHHNIDYLVGLYALRFDLAPPPELPTWWTTASKHFSVCTNGRDDFHIDLLSEKAAKLNYQRQSGCAPTFLKKTLEERRAESDAEEWRQEQLYLDQFEADPNYQEDVQNQLIANSFQDSFSSEEYWNGFSSSTYKPRDYD